MTSPEEDTLRELTLLERHDDLIFPFQARPEVEDFSRKRFPL